MEKHGSMLGVEVVGIQELKGRNYVITFDLEEKALKVFKVVKTKKNGVPMVVEKIWDESLAIDVMDAYMSECGVDMNNPDESAQKLNAKRKKLHSFGSFECTVRSNMSQIPQNVQKFKKYFNGGEELSGENKVFGMIYGLLSNGGDTVIYDEIESDELGKCVVVVDFVESKLAFFHVDYEEDEIYKEITEIPKEDSERIDEILFQLLKKHNGAYYKGTNTYTNPQYATDDFFKMLDVLDKVLETKDDGENW